jgi:hypothetical protein
MLSLAKKTFFIILIVFCFTTTKTLAAETQINAGLLKNIWYSKTDVYEGDKLKIFSGIYNQSDTSFSGTAVFYADNEEIFKDNFISKPETLVEVSGSLVASSSRISIKVKISDIKILNSTASSTVSSDYLLSSETDSSTISINKKITLEEVKNTVTEVASNIVTAIDEKAATLSDSILALKKTEVTTVDTSNAGKIIEKENLGQINGISTTTSLISKVIGEVLGAETQYNEAGESGIWSQIKNSKFGVSVYNYFLDFLSLVVRFWKISLFVIIAIILIIKFLV